MPDVALGIDLGGTNCRAAWVASDGQLGPIRKVATPFDQSYPGFVDFLADLVRDLISRSRADGRSVTAIGMGVPGIVGHEGSIRVSPNLGCLDGQPLAADLAGILEIPTIINNDANAICWGEARYGAGRMFDSFLTVTLGTGVGGGLVFNRKIWTGSDGAAGEVGHLVVVPEGRPCKCGSRGCLEQYASASGIVKGARERLAAGGRSLLDPLEDSALTSAGVAAAARRGDPLALEVFEEAGRSLGFVFAGVANLLNLDGVVVTGGASDSLDLMAPAIDRGLRARAFPVPASRLKVVRGELSDSAGILGAAALSMPLNERTPFCPGG